MHKQDSRNLAQRIERGSRWGVISLVLFLSMMLTVAIMEVATVSTALAQEADTVTVGAENSETTTMTDPVSLVAAGRSGQMSVQRGAQAPIWPTLAPPITPTTRPSGTVIVNNGPYACPGGVGAIPGGTCYDIAVDCSQAITQTTNMQALIKVDESTISVTNGTILFLTGFDGRYLWETQNANSTLVISDLLQSGYRTVQVDWGPPWWRAEDYAEVGFGGQACNPSAVAEWVLESSGIITTALKTTEPYCATGHSNGASALAYAAAQYDLADQFAIMLFEGGPNWSRVDYACTPTHPLYFGTAGRKLIDRSFGFNYNGGEGYCFSNTLSALPLWEEASIVYNNWDFVHPRTVASFIMGELDDSLTKPQGELYYNRLLQGGTPHLLTTTVTGSYAFVNGDPNGGQIISNTLVNECISAVAPLVSIIQSGNDVQLGWMTATANLVYDVHVNATPYFTPTGATLDSTLAHDAVAYVDANIITTASMQFYIINGGRGNTLAPSNQIGMFKFPIVPGS